MPDNWLVGDGFAQILVLLCHETLNKTKTNKNEPPKKEKEEKKRKKKEREKEGKVPPRFELGSWDSESQVLTVTPRNQTRTINDQ